MNTSDHILLYSQGLQKKHRNVFLSLSSVINGRSPNHKALIAACESNRILVESDYYDVDMCAERTWDMLETVAEVKGWHVEEEWVNDLEESQWGVVHKLEENWFAFKGEDRKTQSQTTQAVLG